jgi:DNA-binding MarR family transcriptional regulator
MAAEVPAHGGARLADEPLQFVQRIWQLANALDVASNRMARRLNVTGPQRLVLRIVALRPSSTAQRIATALGMHHRAVMGVLARLQRRRFLVRTVGTGRGQPRFRMTDDGRMIARERKGTVEAAIRRALARVRGRVLPTLAMVDLLIGELERDAQDTSLY